MDKLDIAVLRSLFFDVHNYPSRSELHEPLSEIARKLRVSEPTVRSRIKGYAESGFLKGWSVFVNPNTIGQRVAQAHFDILPPSSRQDAIRKIKLIDGVWFLASYHDNTLAIGLYFEDEASLRGRLELISRIANSEHVAHGEILFPPCSYRFSPADLAIIKSIQGEPWQTFASIAKQAPASIKTVRRRLNGMIREKALFIAPKVDFRHLKGLIPVDLFVFYANWEVAREAEKKIFSLVDEMLITAILGGPEHSYFALTLDNIGQANDISSRVKEFEGVKEVYTGLVDEHLEQHQAFTLQIERLSRAMEQKAFRSTTASLLNSSPRH